MSRAIFILCVFTITVYSCSPINKQHGYLVDDIVISSDNMALFEINKTTKSDIYATMGSPSIEITDVNNVWIYLISLKEKKLMESDNITFQTVFRFEFNQKEVLVRKDLNTSDDYSQISFSQEKTTVIRDAYGIGDQLYDAFTRGR